MATVIVFGPTGNIGSVAARTAQANGVKVVLAMRDTTKSIRGLSSEEEKSGNFERVQADLTKPDTVAEAVKKTGASRAFIYVAMGSPDHMRATLEALKSAGITFVVLLSSYTIHRDPRNYTPAELIPFVHAQVELQLDDVFGPENYVAVRPGGFATNLLRFKNDIAAGHVEMYVSEFSLDCITPIDMGRVSGTILAEGKPRDPNQRKVYLYGPKVYTQGEAIGVIGEVLGKEIKISELDEQGGRDQLNNAGFPKPAVEYMIKMLTQIKNGEAKHERANYDEGVKNVELYTGKPSTGLKEWLQDNMDLFSA